QERRACRWPSEQAEKDSACHFTSTRSNELVYLAFPLQYPRRVRASSIFPVIQSSCSPQNNLSTLFPEPRSARHHIAGSASLQAKVFRITSGSPRGVGT